MVELVFREAKREDLESLIGMLFDDELGMTREDASIPLNPAYIETFQHIENDNNNQLIVVETDGAIVGMLQLTYIPYLTYIGSWRCLIEGVRVSKTLRGRGIGRRMFQWAIEQAKKKKCILVQLTSDKQRPEAIKFYQALGFVASHEGFKLKLGKDIAHQR